MNKNHTRQRIFRTASRIAALCGLVTLLFGCDNNPAPVVTFTFDSLTCKNVSVVSSTATVSAGPQGVLLVTVCVKCLDPGSGASVGTGARVTLGGYEEFFVPQDYKNQIATPLTYNSTTGCYEKKVVLKNVGDPHGVLGGKQFTINVADKSGQTATTSTVTVVAIP